MSQNDPKIEALVERLFELTRGYKHEYVTLEHLLAVLLETEEVQDIFYDIDKDPNALRQAIITYLENEVDSVDNIEDKQPQKTVMLERVFNRAFTQALFNGRAKLDPRDLLISILTEESSPAVFLLQQNDVTRDSLVGYLSNIATDEAGVNTRDKPLKQERILEKFCDNLNELALVGEIDPMIGREQELEQLVQTLARRKKNNVILVGESGVGKTAIAEGLAHLINDESVPDVIAGNTIYSLDIGALLALSLIHI